MPFKTKSRKLAAKDRRFEYVQKFQLGYEGTRHEKVGTNLLHKQSTAVEDFGFVKRDLLKIFSLASLVVLLQLFLYFIL